MCELNLVTLQCVSVKLLSMLLVFVFHVWHFADGPLGLVSQTPEINVFYTERRKACFEETSLVARFRFFTRELLIRKSRICQYLANFTELHKLMPKF